MAQFNCISSWVCRAGGSTNLACRGSNRKASGWAGTAGWATGSSSGWSTGSAAALEPSDSDEATGSKSMIAATGTGGGGGGRIQRATPSSEASARCGYGCPAAPGGWSHLLRM